MYVIVRNGLFYSRTKTYPMMDIREHPNVLYLYERLVRNAEWYDSKLEANKVCKEVNGQKVIQLSEAARQRLLLIKRNRKGE
jgi:hypothetical protein